MEILIGTMVGAFMWSNAEFFSTAKTQKEAGAEWVFNPKEHNPEAPAITINENKVIWVLETE